MEDILQALRAAAEQTRLRILVLCAHSELSVGELVQILGQSQPRVSRHLKLLMEAKLLERHQEGSQVFYRQATDGLIGEIGLSLIDQLPEDDGILAVDLERLQEIRQKRAERAEEYFRANAANWEDLRGLYIDDKQLDQKVAEVLTSRPLEDLLDIGTGTGRVLRLVGERVKSAIGIDNSRDMLAIARANLDQDKLRHCQIRQGDMYRLPFNQSRFDAITLNMVLRYADDPSSVLREAARVLKSGGRIIITDFAPHELTELRDNHAHSWLGFSDEVIARLAEEAGLELHAPRYLEGDPLTVCIWVAEKPSQPMQHPTKLTNPQSKGAGS